jgi:hypothetical protein
VVAIKVRNRHGIGATAGDIGDGRRKGAVAVAQEDADCGIAEIGSHDVQLAVPVKVPHRHGLGLVTNCVSDRSSERAVTADAAKVIAEFDKRGIQLVAIAESFDMTSPYGRAMAQMASVFAELERAIIRERTRSAMSVKRSRGERISGHAP